MRKTLLSAGIGIGAVVTIVLGFSVLAPDVPAEQAVDTAPLVTVYKSAACECCDRWVTHLRDAGFEVTVREVSNLAEIKTQHGVAPHLQSCHTALVDGYVVEGHVPADLVRRLLAERPDVAGLTVPGMPIGSPGMEIGEPAAYDVLTFDANGTTALYARR